MIAEDIGIEGQSRRFHIVNLDWPADHDPGIIDQHVEGAARTALSLGNCRCNLIVGQDIEGKDAKIEPLRSGDFAQFCGFRPWKIAHRRKDLCAEPGIMQRAEPPETR